MVGDWRRKVAVDILEDLWDCTEPDWDSYGALLVSAIAIVKAALFVLRLPLGIGEPSEFGPINVGSIDLCWDSQDEKSHLLVSFEGDQYWVAILNSAVDLDHDDSVFKRELTYENGQFEVPEELKRWHQVEVEPPPAPEPSGIRQTLPPERSMDPVTQAGPQSIQHPRELK